MIEGRISGLLAYPTPDGQAVLLRTAQGKDAIDFYTDKRVVISRW